MRRFWHRHIYNTYEPDNCIYLEGELVGDTVIADRMRFNGYFRDGGTHCSIFPWKGEFAWIVESYGSHDLRNELAQRRTGKAPTFIEAWHNLPALITNPEEWEDDPDKPCEEPNLTEGDNLEALKQPLCRERDTPVHKNYTEENQSDN